MHEKNEKPTSGPFVVPSGHRNVLVVTMEELMRPRAVQASDTVPDRKVTS